MMIVYFVCFMVNAQIVSYDLRIAPNPDIMNMISAIYKILDME